MMKRSSNVDEKRRDTTRQLTLAEEGDAAAQNSIGARLAQGYFVKQDQSGALYWYSQAVKQGYTHAKFNMGTMLVAGEGVASVHTDLGMMLIRQAAECGDASACNFLSHCYEHGAYGVSRDIEARNQWIVRAQNCPNFLEYGVRVNLEDYGLTFSKPSMEWN